MKDIGLSPRKCVTPKQYNAERAYLRNMKPDGKKYVYDSNGFTSVPTQGDCCE